MKLTQNVKDAIQRISEIDTGERSRLLEGLKSLWKKNKNKNYGARDIILEGERWMSL